MYQMSASGRPRRNKLLGVEATRRPAGRRIRDLELLRLYVTPALGKIRLPYSRPATSPRRCAQWSPVPLPRHLQCGEEGARPGAPPGKAGGPHLSQCRIYPIAGFMVGDTPVKGKERRSMTRLGTSSLRSGNLAIHRSGPDSPFAPHEGSISHSVPSLPTAQLDTLPVIALSAGIACDLRADRHAAVPSICTYFRSDAGPGSPLTCSRLSCIFIRARLGCAAVGQGCIPTVALSDHKGRVWGCSPTGLEGSGTQRWGWSPRGTWHSHR